MSSAFEAVAGIHRKRSVERIVHFFSEIISVKNVKIFLNISKYNQPRLTLWMVDILKDIKFFIILINIVITLIKISSSIQVWMVVAPHPNYAPPSFYLMTKEWVDRNSSHCNCKQFHLKKDLKKTFFKFCKNKFRLMFTLTVPVVVKPRKIVG